MSFVPATSQRDLWVILALMVAVIFGLHWRSRRDGVPPQGEVNPQDAAPGREE